MRPDEQITLPWNSYPMFADTTLNYIQNQQCNLLKRRSVIRLLQLAWRIFELCSSPWEKEKKTPYAMIVIETPHLLLPSICSTSFKSSICIFQKSESFPWLCASFWIYNYEHIIMPTQLIRGKLVRKKRIRYSTQNEFATRMLQTTEGKKFHLINNCLNWNCFFAPTLREEIFNYTARNGNIITPYWRKMNVNKFLTLVAKIKKKLCESLCRSYAMLARHPGKVTQPFSA